MKWIKSILNGWLNFLALFVVREVFGEYKTLITQKQLKRGVATTFLIHFADSIIMRVTVLADKPLKINIPSKLKNGISILIGDTNAKITSGTFKGRPRVGAMEKSKYKVFNITELFAMRKECLKHPEDKWIVDDINKELEKRSEI